MLWTRDEYLAYMTFHDVGKDLFTELFGPLKPLEAEWRAQGATPEDIDLSAFGWDAAMVCHAPANVGAITQIEPKVLSETETDQYTIDAMGRHMRLCKNAATIALPLDYPVKTPEDWERVKPWYAFREDRVDKEALKHTAELRKKGFLVTATMPGGFDEPRQLMGEEELCIALYEYPEMIHDMLDTFADTSLKVLERINDIVQVDCLCVHEDMAGKSGPLFGPEHVREFMKPYYRKVWDEAHRQGAVLFSQDSDGNMNAVIDAFIESGVNVMYPFEPAAGMDMVEVRRRVGNKLAIKGGIDKHTLRKDKEAIRRELEYKLSDEMRHGGTCFALDHRIPNGVSLENYRYYVKLGREMLGLPVEREPSPFVRMAF